MTQKHTRVYYELLAAAATPGVRYIDNEGGTRSGKTYATLQLLVNIAKGSPRPLVISVVSETMPHLKRGAVRDFQAIIGDEWDPAAWSKVDCIYSFPSGSIIEFFSADNPGKVHGPARDILFLNEANHVDYDTARQLFVRTRDLVLFDYNPTHAFWAHEQIAPRPNCVHVHSTYQDNLENLSPEQIAEIESNRSDTAWWRVYGEGKVGELEGLIFQDVELVDGMPDTAGLREVYGMDFGYANDPSVLLRILLNTGTKTAHVDEIFYRGGMKNDDLAAAMEEAAVPKRSVPIFADCAEPKTIDTLGDYGWNVLKSYKGKRKAEQLQEIRGWHIRLTKHSLDTIREIRGYCWAKDKDGRLLNEPQTLCDHAMDALRYGVFTYLTKYATGGSYNLGFSTF